jgi:hypothetical protein
MKKSLRRMLLILSPLILFMGLLPGLSSLDRKLLFGLELEFLGFIGWKFRRDLTEWSLKKVKENRELWRKNYNLRGSIGVIACIALGFFFLLSYLLEAINK